MFECGPIFCILVACTVNFPHIAWAPSNNNTFFPGQTYGCPIIVNYFENIFSVGICLK